MSLLVNVQTPRSMVGAMLMVGIELSWVDTATGKPHRFEISAPALPIVPAGSPLLDERNTSVTEQAALQQAALNQREAMRLDREGHYAESREAHKQAAALLASMPQTDLISERLSEAEAFALFAPNSAMPEQIRKQAVHNSFRRGRGRSDES